MWPALLRPLRRQQQRELDVVRAPLSIGMATTFDNVIGVLLFPLIMLIGVATFISAIQSKGTAEMSTDDWISAVLAGSTVLVGGSFHVFPMNHGEAGTAAVCILMPFGGLAVLAIRESSFAWAAPVRVIQQRLLDYYVCDVQIS